MVITAGILRPYKDLSMNLTAIFNEVMITVLIGFSGVFMVKDMHNDTALELGWVWVGIASFTIVVNWVVLITMQIYNIWQKRQKIKADETAKQKTTAEHVPKRKVIDMAQDSKEMSQYEINSYRSEYSPEKTIEKHKSESHMFSPTQDTKQWRDQTDKHGDLMIDNHYDDQIYEEEKVTHTVTTQSKKRRKVSNLDDEYCAFGFSPTIPTYSTPNRVLSSHTSDGVQQSGDKELSISVQLNGEAEYPETPSMSPDKPRGSRKGSDDVISYSSSVRQFTGYGSNKNILRVKDLQD
jgi:hypothetical protein